MDRAGGRERTEDNFLVHSRGKPLHPSDPEQELAELGEGRSGAIMPMIRLAPLHDRQQIVALLLQSG